MKWWKNRYNIDMVLRNITYSQKKLHDFCRRWKIIRLEIFGSAIRDDFNEESDIDIIVELERPIGWKFFSLELYLESIFNRKIDLVTKNALKKQIKDSILKQVSYI